MRKYDFSGYATRNDIVCSDGRTIRRNAFADQDGQEVPLVWQHQHNSPDNILGHALLENRKDGVYAYCSFNGTESAARAKELVRHGDIKSLSIYANKLTQKAGNVTHGSIREVSLVLTGANPGAFIDFPVLEHGDDVDIKEAYIYMMQEIDSNSGSLSLSHEDDSSDDDSEYDDDYEDEADEDYDDEDEDDDSDYDEDYEEEDDDMGEDSIREIYDGMTPEQQAAVEVLVGLAVEDAEAEFEHSDEGDNDDMRYRYNVFDNHDDDSIMHSEDLDTLIHDGLADAKAFGSMRDSFLAHAQDYGIDDITFLFPEYKNLNNPPEFIKRDTGWVSKWMSGVTKRPFSRIKSQFADITEDEARAKGYIKGNRKKEEVFTLLRRTTDPQTIYKKQKLDRDDMLDITDFDVVVWMKAEMRGMLEEECARAMLIGDGRSTSDQDKIQEAHIRPVITDEDLFTIKMPVIGNTPDKRAENMIEASIRARIGYKGSGSPTMWTTEEWITEGLLLKDGIGHRLYKTEGELATAMRVKELVAVEVMEGQTVKVDGTEYPLMGVIINPTDYSVGADKGSQVAMFEDFDIDYNQMKYLIETRMSGALTKPFSAIVLYYDESESKTKSKWRNKKDGTTANGYNSVSSSGSEEPTEPTEPTGDEPTNP